MNTKILMVILLFLIIPTASADYNPSFKSGAQMLYNASASISNLSAMRDNRYDAGAPYGIIGATSDTGAKFGYEFATPRDFSSILFMQSAQSERFKDFKLERYNSGAWTKVPISCVSGCVLNGTDEGRINNANGNVSIEFTTFTDYMFRIHVMNSWGIGDNNAAIEEMDVYNDTYYIPIIASDTVQYSNDSVIGTTSIAYIKLKEITTTENYTGSLNISFEMTNALWYSYAKAILYKNGAVYGTEKTVAHPNNDQVYEMFTDTFVGDWANGDKIELYGITEFAASNTYVKNFRINFDYDYANATITPTYPTNNSVISFSFPPQTTSIKFTWSQIAESGYEIMIAKDINFNIMVADTTTTLPYSSHVLENATYYWKVRTYNDDGATLGAWSDTFSFTLASVTTGITGTVLNGVVYELINENPVPVDGATVYISNATATYSFQTGSNGYYQFNNLTNLTTFTIYAIKQGYDNSQFFYVVPTSNAVTTLNIPMRIYISPYVPNFVFEKIVIRTLYDEAYPGLTLNVYKGTSLTVSFSGTTDSNGAVVFQLIKDQYYRMEISGGSLSSTLTFYFYAKEESLMIVVSSGFPTGGNKYTDINATLSVSSLNTTYSNLSLYYDDLSLTTSVVNFYAKNLTTGLYPCSNQTSATYPATFNCSVERNGTYQFGYNATSSKYGFIQQDKIVNFNASNTTIPQAIGSKIDSTMLNWISIMGLICIAGLFSVQSVKFGTVIVPLMAVVLYWFGALHISGIIVHMALVLGVLAYMRMSEQKVT